jgi:hypothetical protein
MALVASTEVAWQALLILELVTSSLRMSHSGNSSGSLDAAPLAYVFRVSDGVALSHSPFL